MPNKRLSKIQIWRKAPKRLLPHLLLSLHYTTLHAFYAYSTVTKIISQFESLSVSGETIWIFVTSMDALASVLEICNLGREIQKSSPRNPMHLEICNLPGGGREWKSAATRFTAQILSLCKLTIQKVNFNNFNFDFYLTSLTQANYPESKL